MSTATAGRWILPMGRPPGPVRLWLLLMLSLAIQGTADAGKNKNGALIVHTNDAYIFSTGTACSTPLGDPGTCGGAVTRSDKASGTVVWLLAAFLPTASPGVAGIYFGIDYDDLNLDPGTSFKTCGPAGTLDAPDTDWPYTGRGNTVGFGTPITGDVLFPFYVFRIDGGATGSYFGTVANPIGGYAAFFDDSAPPVTDRCGNFGTIRWYQPGSNSCPAPPTCRITVTSPNTAVSWTQGTLHEITWNSSQCGSAVAIDLLANGTICASIAAETPNSGQYGWVAQQCNGGTSGYKVRVTDLISGEADESDAAFSIPGGGCQINVTAPNGGERLLTGSPLTIVWGSTSCGATVKIELVKNGTPCAVIAEATANTGSFPWTAASCGIEECVYKVRVTDISSGRADESDGSFCIRPCTIAVTSPNGGERWSPGTAQTITWTSSGCGGNVKVELLQDGAPCATIANPTANDGSLPWTAQPCAGASGYRIRITDLDTGIQGNSEGDFCIGCDDVFSVPGGLQFTIGQETAEVSIQGKNAQPLQGYSVHLCFDPAILECLDISLDGTRGSGAASLLKNCSAGCAQATVGYSASCPPQIAPGEGSILKVIFRVKAGAPLGPTMIDISDAAGGLNRMIPCGSPAFPPQLVDGSVEILPEHFKRGDDNADGTATIADPLYCLAYQYGGGPVPPCMDAGDFDDSGRYDLSDCIANLCRQFAGCGNPPGPYESCGPDPTPQDPLDCDSFAPCGTRTAQRPAAPDRSVIEGTARLTCTPDLSGDTLRIAVDASAGEPAIGLQFDLTVDPGLLRFLSVERSVDGPDYFSARYEPESPILRVGCVPDLALQDPLPAVPRRLGEILFLTRSVIPPEGGRIAIGNILYVTPDFRTLAVPPAELTFFPGPSSSADGPGGIRLIVLNPMPPGSEIRVRVAGSLPARLDVYTIQGRHLRTLFDGDLQRGEHALVWDGKGEDGNEAASGIYCLRAMIGGERIERKFVRIR